MANAYNKAGADPINEYHINNTEADLMAHLAPGQFGFATDTYRIVVNIPDGGSGIIKKYDFYTGYSYVGNNFRYAQIGSAFVLQYSSNGLIADYITVETIWEP